ncbi:MAG: hypothetical protein PVI63_04010, partial [Anaerolineae bacterium]
LTSGDEINTGAGVGVGTGVGATVAAAVGVTAGVPGAVSVGSKVATEVETADGTGSRVAGEGPSELSASKATPTMLVTTNSTKRRLERGDMSSRAGIIRPSGDSVHQGQRRSDRGAPCAHP